MVYIGDIMSQTLEVRCLLLQYVRARVHIPTHPISRDVKSYGGEITYIFPPFSFAQMITNLAHEYST